MCVDSCQIPIFVSNENIDLTAQTEKRDICQLSKVKHLTWWRRTEFYTSCPTSQWMFIVEDFNMSSYSLKKRQVKVGWIDNDGNTRRIVTYKTATSPDELIAQTEVSANDRSATGLTHCSSSMCWVSCWLDIKTTENQKENQVRLPARFLLPANQRNFLADAISWPIPLCYFLANGVVQDSSRSNASQFEDMPSKACKLV